MLVFTSQLICVFMLFFADSGERAVVPGLLVGTVVSVITSMLLLLTVLNDPFHDGVGGLRPVAVQRALKVIDQELQVSDADAPAPCDARGNALDGRLLTLSHAGSGAGAASEPHP